MATALHSTLGKNFRKIRLGVRVIEPHIKKSELEKPIIERITTPKTIYIIAELIKNATWTTIDLVNFEDPFFFPAFGKIVHPDHASRFPQHADSPAKSTQEYNPSLEDTIDVITSHTANAITRLYGFTRFKDFSSSKQSPLILPINNQFLKNVEEQIKKMAQRKPPTEPIDGEKRDHEYH